MKGRPPVDRARLDLAVELLKNGATTAEAARSSGVARNTLSRYGISKRAIDSTKDVFQIKIPPATTQTITQRLDSSEREIAASFLMVIARQRIPLIATAEAAQMESERLQVCVRAERLRKTAKRLSGKLERNHL